MKAKDIIRSIDFPFEIYRISCILLRIFMYITIVSSLQSGIIALVLIPWLLGSRNWHQICRILTYKRKHEVVKDES